jgi:hypothetical protein
MLISSLRLERKGQKAFREDLSDSEDKDMGFPNRFCDKYPQLAIRSQQVCDESQDVQYLGGKPERNKNGSSNRSGKQKEGCFDKLMSMNGSG